MPQKVKSRPQKTRLQKVGPGDHAENGRPSAFACPECHGVLWEVEDGQRLLRFRCRVGHAYTAASLKEEQEHALEAALWSAIRTLEEEASLSTRMAGRSQGTLAERFRDRAEEKFGHASLLRDLARNAVPSANAAARPAFSPASNRRSSSRDRSKRPA